MKDPAVNRTLASVLLFLGLSWLLAFQPIPGWGGAIEISSVRIAVSMHSETVRFRTLLSGSGQSFVAVAIGTGQV